MDRRQIKTREAIFSALNLLIKEKSFREITVQEIIEKANIGRSTFYAHFETKEVLLKALCGEIFNHISAMEKSAPVICGYIPSESPLRDALAHVLKHIQDEKWNLSTFIIDDSSHIFTNYYIKELEGLFNNHLDELEIKVPQDYLLYQLAAGFACATRWWVEKRYYCTPELMADNYLKTVSGKRISDTLGFNSK